jgi:tetratricopeptide (TPR) repeat protein
MPSHRLLCLASLSLATALSAQAAVFKDPQLQSVWEGGKVEELDRLAQARLRTNPADTQAAAALALSALDAGDGARLDAAAKTMQQCVERQPRDAVCHFALGRVLGAQAMGASMFKAMSLAGKVKDAFSKAFELEPASFEMRSALQQFYLMAPGMAGGSVSKARELAQDLRDMPEHAKLMRARVAQHEDNYAEAERELASLKPGKDLGLLTEWREAWAGQGYQYLRDKQYAKAKAWFEQLQREQPQHAAASYGLGRVATETGQLDEAIRQFERARSLEGAEALPLDHRLGVAWQMKGDKAQAKALLERFVANKKANPRNLEDARKRLAELG